MCGFAGIARRDGQAVSSRRLGSMAAAVRHRGPDGYGFHADRGVGIAHVRLSVIDIEGGAQPMSTPDGELVIAFNGEVFNYVELREELEGRGKRFRTRCDTEVLLQAFAEWGTDCLHRLNGQFAFAVHDRRDDSVFLARDRFGVRPLFYAETDIGLIFGSEIKALYASGAVERGLDPVGLDQVFTFWAARPPRTPFRGVRSLQPGEFASWSDGRLTLRRYYELDYPGAAGEPPDAVERLDDLMRDSVRLRLRADVTVGGYLSGGLDSSITCALSSPLTRELRTFSITFEDPEFDESEFQQLVAADLGTQHTIEPIGQDAIASVFPEVVRHAEAPLVRTAPAPLYLLARSTRAHGIKVVLTGEGADELFWGYDLFKEVAVRRFCLRQPDSERRPLLFDRLYPYLTGQGRGGSFWRRFFLEAGPVSDPLFSHLPRFNLTARIKEFYSPGMADAVQERDALGELRDDLPEGFGSWTPLAKAAYLEMTTLLAPYLLSSQGDRMAMAHGVEGRFPFLDHRLFEYSTGLPDRSKLRTLTEKEILRRWAADIVPERVGTRPKQPYRAPDILSFFGSHAPEYLEEMLSTEALEKVGVFDPPSVEGLLRRCRSGRATGFRENQAFVAILSTQFVHDEVVRAPVPAPLPVAGADVLSGEQIDQPVGTN